MHTMTSHFFLLQESNSSAPAFRSSAPLAPSFAPVLALTLALALVSAQHSYPSDRQASVHAFDGAVYSSSACSVLRLVDKNPVSAEALTSLHNLIIDRLAPSSKADAMPMAPATMPNGSAIVKINDNAGFTLEVDGERGRRG
ncbi:hypothetical protein O988_01803 [Pseudogymnoascus sp. VKM F-3808]|nr:hypothetical protein O988_01803 [Pseudogymnoascus sp. VKM F-3808]